MRRHTQDGQPPLRSRRSDWTTSPIRDSKIMGRAGSPGLPHSKGPSRPRHGSHPRLGLSSAQFLDHKSRNNQSKAAVSDAVEGRVALSRRRRSVVGIACGGVGGSIPTIKGLEAQAGDLGGRDYTAGKIISALEAAGVEFTNGRRPGVRRRSGGTCTGD